MSEAGAFQEQALLSALLTVEDPTHSVYEVADILRTEHFADKRYGTIYDIILREVRKRALADVPGVAKLAEQEGIPADFVKALAKPEVNLPLKALKKTAEDIREAYQLRQGKTVAAETAEALTVNDLKGGHAKLGRILDAAVANPFGLTSRDAPRILDHLAKMRKTGFDGMLTGYAGWDSLACGLRPGDVTVVAGGPGVGKSLLAWCAAWNLAPERKVGCISLEMSEEDIHYMLFRFVSGVDPGRIRMANMTDVEFERISAGLSTVMAKDFVIDYTSFALNDLVMRVRRMRSEFKIELLIMDYLQLVRTDDDDTKEGEVAAVSRAMKELASTLGIHVLLLSQLSRKKDSRQDHEPQMGDVRYSGMVEADAAVLLMLWRQLDEQVTHAKVEKNRHVGRFGRFDLAYDNGTGRYKDVAVGI